MSSFVYFQVPTCGLLVLCLFFFFCVGFLVKKLETEMCEINLFVKLLKLWTLVLSTVISLFSISLKKGSPGLCYLGYLSNCWTWLFCGRFYVLQYSFCGVFLGGVVDFLLIFLLSSLKENCFCRKISKAFIYYLPLKRFLAGTKIKKGEVSYVCVTANMFVRQCSSLNIVMIVRTGINKIAFHFFSLVAMFCLIYESKPCQICREKRFGHHLILLYCLAAKYYIYDIY